MRKGFEWYVAGRYLRARSQEKLVSIIAILSFLGIMLGVATLIIVTAVMNGFHKELLGQILGINGHLRVYHSQQQPLYYQPVVDRLKEHLNVTLAHPIIEKQGMVTSAHGAAAVIVHGIASAHLQKREMITSKVKWGTSIFNDDQHILIGKRLAEKLGVLPGGKLTLMIPQGTATPFGMAPRAKTFKVGGVFEMGMVDYDNAYVFMPLEVAQVFFRLPEGTCTNVEIFTDNLSKASDRVPGLMAKLPPELGILDWQKANTGYFEAIKVERNVMFIILTLIIVVAVFNVISSLIMLVKDKSQEIAIFKTIGAARTSILKIFLLIGGSIGLAGTILGGILGCIFAANIESIRKGLEKITHTNLFQAEIYFWSKLPAELNIYEVMSIMLMAMVLTLLAAFYPAWRASRLDPVDTLRQI
ncbi:MAG: lipoprotein-releasing ABC transporter permease subunit [Alphaproteobacteria bacterium]|nr:lipoprotein-releasing ABC transporter permease subunit [Alphaproteobacteria bacterium]